MIVIGQEFEREHTPRLHDFLRHETPAIEAGALYLSHIGKFGDPIVIWVLGDGVGSLSQKGNGGIGRCVSLRVLRAPPKQVTKVGEPDLILKLSGSGAGPPLLGVVSGEFSRPPITSAVGVIRSTGACLPKPSIGRATSPYHAGDLKGYRS